MVLQKFSMVSLSDYAKNKIYKELPNPKRYFRYSDEKIFIDLKRSKGYSGELEKLAQDDCDLTITVMLKEAVKQKMRLRVTGYYQGE